MPASLKHLSGPPENIKSILARWSDGKFYRAEKLSLDLEAKKCLVKFEDGLEAWLATTELHMELAIDDIQDEDIVCCVCDDGTSAEPNEIIMCDGCQQGYHVQCHKPSIDRERVKLEDDLVEWFCCTCDYLIKPSKSKPVKTKAASARKPATPPKEANARKAASQPKSTGKGKAEAKKQRPSTPMVKSSAAKIKLGRKPQTAATNQSSPPPTQTLEGSPDITTPKSTSDAPAASELGEQPSDDQKMEQEPILSDSIVAAFETVRIKKTEKRRAPEEETSNHVEEPPPNISKVQTEKPLVVEIAQVLSRENQLIDTQAFNEVVCGISRATKEKGSKSKLPTGAGKRKSNAGKSAPLEAAAAY